MLRDITEAEYLSLRRDKSVKDSAVVGLGFPLMKAVACTSMHLLTSSEACALLYLFGATLCKGQLAREITIREFENGIQDDEDSALDCGTGMSRMTVKTALRGLCDKDFLHIHRKSGSDTSPRIYEINFKLLLSDTEIATILAKKEAQLVAKSSTKGAKIYPPLHTYIKSKRDTSISFLPASSLDRKSNAEQVGSMAFIGKQKKPTPTPVVYGSATEALQAVQGRARAVQATRVASAATTAPSALSRLDMQAIFDKHGTALGLSYRLMVTQREHGFLRKRLVENPPKDFSDFVRWSLTYWGTLAAQNQVATRKDLQVRVIRKSLPPAPHFNTFCYWYPYFLKSYQNFAAGRDYVKDGERQGQTEQDRVIKSLERRVAEAERNTAVLRRRMGSSKEGIQTPPAAPTARPRTRTDADLLAPVEFKEWDSNNRTGRKS